MCAGVFDNLFDYEICNIANLALSPYESLVGKGPQTHRHTHTQREREARVCVCTCVCVCVCAGAPREVSRHPCPQRRHRHCRGSAAQEVHTHTHTHAQQSLSIHPSIHMFYLSLCRCSKDPLSRSPFAKSARQNHTHYMGGKLDDITVIAAWVTR